MLFWHSHPETYQQHAQSNYIRDALAPFLKHEEESVFFSLCALCSHISSCETPGGNSHISYQGQSYEIRMLNRKLVEYTDISSKYVKSIVHVVFHDRRLQYTEHQQLEGWRWNRPGDRILDIAVFLIKGISNLMFYHFVIIYYVQCVMVRYRFVSGHNGAAGPPTAAQHHRVSLGS